MTVAKFCVLPQSISNCQFRGKLVVVLYMSTCNLP